MITHTACYKQIAINSNVSHIHIKSRHIIEEEIPIILIPIQLSPNAQSIPNKFKYYTILTYLLSIDMY